jgi:hypothetical protein
LSAFDYTKDKLELENGDFAGWRDEDKVAVAQQLLQAAKDSFFAERDGACGAAFTSKRRLPRTSKLKGCF